MLVLAQQNGHNNYIKAKQAHMRTAWYNIFKRLKQLYSMHWYVSKW